MQEQQSQGRPKDAEKSRCILCQKRADHQSERVKQVRGRSAFQRLASVVPGCRQIRQVLFCGGGHRFRGPQHDGAAEDGKPGQNTQPPLPVGDAALEQPGAGE